MRLNMPLWWSVVLLCACGLGLAGCDSPSPGFGKGQKMELDVADMRFSVHYTVWQAEAIRTNAMWGVKRGDAMLKGAVAIERASGCKIVPRSLRGDTNIVRADIDCPGAPPRPARARRPLEFDCGVVGGYGSGRHGPDYSELECTLIR